MSLASAFKIYSILMILKELCIKNLLDFFYLVSAANYERSMLFKSKMIITLLRDRLFHYIKSHVE